MYDADVKWLTNDPFEPTRAISHVHMLRLRALGSAAVIRDGIPLDGAASQSRRIALLTVIACAGIEGISRDTLLALLWPESPEDRARHALSQWLFLIRRDLGADDLITGSKTLRLNTDRMTADVAEFDTAIAAKEWLRAASFYRGPLLEGLLLSNAPEFQQWLDRARTQRHAQAKRAIEQVARGYESTDPAQAITWWQRLAAIDPHSGPTASKVIRLLAASGDGIAAMAFARRHVEALRNDLDLSPSADVAGLIEEVGAELRSRTARTASGVPRAPDDPYHALVRDRLATRFIVDGLVARTSLMTTFAARRTADLSPVTLKVFVPDLLARTDRQRLLTLLESAARMRHAHIESPDEVAEVEGVMYCAVTEAEGTLLRDQVAADSSVPAGDIVTIGSQLAAGLAHAHEHGHTHGNLTPRRVAMRAPGATLTELGVLPAFSASLARTPHDSGFPLGNPSYMSPELLMGDGAMEAPSDVYSLGCILYQLFTGLPPHAGSSTRAMLAARVREPAAPMALREHPRPRGLDRLVAAMLEREPGARPSSAAVHRELSGLRSSLQ